MKNTITKNASFAGTGARSRFPTPLHAQEVEVDGLRYKIGRETATLVGYSEDFAGDVAIPKTIAYAGDSGGTKTYPVTMIGYRAFQNCSGLTSIVIPNSVTDIGVNAFNNCKSLTSVEMPNSVTGIGGDAFSGCSNLNAVCISDLAAWCRILFSDYDSNPLHYARRLYLNGTEVKDLVIPDSVTSIGRYAFYDCSGLTSVEIPGSVTSLGEKSLALSRA